MPGVFFVGICLRRTVDAGWVSIYYPVGQDYAGRLANLDALNTAELNLLHSTVVCERIWVSDLEVPGDIESQKPSTGIGAIGSAPEVCTDPAISLPLRVEAGVKQRCTKFLRGIAPNNYNPGDPMTITTSPAWLITFAAYVSQYKQFGQLIHKPTDKAPDFLATQVSSVTLKNAGAGLVKASIRRAGRPFGARRGRRRTG